MKTRVRRVRRSGKREVDPRPPAEAVKSVAAVVAMIPGVIPGRRATRAFVAVLLFALLSCVACEDDEVVCPPVVVPALVVTITDSLTGAPRSAIATAIAIDGAYVDTLLPYALDALGTELSKAGADGRPGTYEVRVTAPGYLDWTRTSIVAPSGECGVRTTQVEARLTLDMSQQRAEPLRDGVSREGTGNRVRRPS